MTREFWNSVSIPLSRGLHGEFAFQNHIAAGVKHDGM